MQFLKRETSPGKASPSGEDFTDPAFAAKFPALAEFLTVGVWPDGQARELGTLLLFVGEGRWKCMLRDKDAARVAFLGGTTVEALFASIEKGLRASSLDWRADKAPAGRRGGR